MITHRCSGTCSYRVSSCANGRRPVWEASWSYTNLIYFRYGRSVLEEGWQAGPGRCSWAPTLKDFLLTFIILSFSYDLSHCSHQKLCLNYRSPADRLFFFYFVSHFCLDVIILLYGRAESLITYHSP